MAAASREAAVPASQASVISGVACVVTLLALPVSTAPPAVVLAAAAAHALHGAALLALRPATPRALLLVGLLLLGLLGATVYVSDAFASGVGPLVVLVFAWFGLHTPPRYLLLVVPWAAATYAGSLVLAGALPRQVASTLVLVPIATVVCLLIANRVAAQRRLREELEVRERWRGALMATLAHDVRAPLSTVIGTLEILQDDPDLDGRYPPLVAAATRQTERVLRLATGLLEVERVADGALVLDEAEVGVADVAATVAALTQADAVHLEVPAGLAVRADAARLEQVLFNLVSNALRHGRPPVVIGAAPTADGVEISVEDHGAGVPAAEVAHLFDRFSTADHSPGSVGLGLWIVRTLVEAHGGEVRYDDSRPGARFVVTLPRTVRGGPGQHEGPPSS